MLHIYGIIVAIAVGVGYWLVLKRARKFNVSEGLLDSLFLPTILGGVIGARLYHVLDKWEYYSQNLSDIFRVWQGGLGIFGALIGGFLGILIYLKLRKIKINLLCLLDLFAPSAALGQAIGRWGNYFNQEVLGPNNEPIFFYESLWMLIGFIILMKLRRNVFSFYLIWYGAGRFVLENWRTDTAVLGEFKTAQIISFIFIVLGLILIERQSKVKV